MLERYLRHTNLKKIGDSGQQTLLDSHVLIIGMGGLGSAAAQYLVAGGIGKITIADFDIVDVSNLQRQVIYKESDVGKSKVEAAKANLQALNSDCDITTIDYHLDEQELPELLANIDIVLDCSDNFETRFTLNRQCVQTKTPLVSGAAIRFEGQVVSFVPVALKSRSKGCYECIYGSEVLHKETCESEGILSPIVGVIGSMQALQAILILLNHTDAIGKLHAFDGLKMSWNSFDIKQNPNCKVCA